MRVKKPWGHEERWAINEKYLGKLLFIKDGHRLSTQYHEQKDETVFVLQGTLTMEIGPSIERLDVEAPDVRTMERGDTLRIEPLTVHRMCAFDGNVVLIEVSTPEINDVVRIEDDYLRDKIAATGLVEPELQGKIDKALEESEISLDEYFDIVELYKTYGGD